MTNVVFLSKASILSMQVNKPTFTESGSIDLLVTGLSLEIGLEYDVVFDLDLETLRGRFLVTEVDVDGETAYLKSNSNITIRSGIPLPPA